MQGQSPERLVAAVDLGSNSFHMTIARLTPSGLQVLVRDRERVRLASGLNRKGVLGNKSIQRGIETLKRFDGRLSGVATEDIRVVATHTLREAKNAHEFLDLASEHFRAQINVISGPEEARLIFQAVAHSQSIEGRVLVFDLGGGSTEFAVGINFETEFLSSRTLGCLTFTKRFMKKLDRESFAEIELNTRKVIEPIVSRIRDLGAEKIFATSGSAKSVSALGNYLGHGPIITPESLESCKNFVLIDMNRRIANIPGVSPERMQILPAGIGIISAIVDELRLSKIEFCDAALREGVLYEMDDRFKSSDIRERTALDMMKKYSVDVDHAGRVRDTAIRIFSAAAPVWGLGVLDYQMVVWASMLHEIGLHVSYSAYQRHGSYIVVNTILPGFSREEQAVLATLILNHRKRFDLSSLPKPRYWSKKRLMRLIRILRIAHVMHVARDLGAPKFSVSVEGGAVSLEFDKEIFRSCGVMLLDLEEESRRQSEEGYSLVIAPAS